MKKQQTQIKHFKQIRGWDKYHTPKELLLGMVEEIGEFRNVIKWQLTEAGVKQQIKENFDEIEDFFGDIMFEICSLANYCEVDVETALDIVIKKHKIRYKDEIK
ncbi:hypothetical protein KJ855_00645 [Patescibacteria group bacterium]|nr:hypothetical protein [Patescibacteria group bacterium]